jgi:hypothetical protein
MGGGDAICYKDYWHNTAILYIHMLSSTKLKLLLLKLMAPGRQWELMGTLTQFMII